MSGSDDHLRRIRELVQRARAAGWAGSVFLLDELASCLDELDQRLSNGGPLPTAWRGALKEAADE